MWRFLLPAVVMMAALIVLFAGALGDLKSLPDLSDRMIGVVGDVPPRRPAPPPPAAPPPSLVALAEQNAAREAVQHQLMDLQKQVGDLQQQVSQRSHDLDVQRTVNSQAQQELDATRAEADKLRHDIDALRQQRKAEEAALSRQRAQTQQFAAARPSPPPPPAPTPAPSAAPVPAEPDPAPPPPAPLPGPSASQQLMVARQWLATGRPDEARRVLAMAQTQMVLQPVTPDQPMAVGNNQSASDIGNAIRWLDMGANNQAMLAINRAIDNASAGEAPRPAWSGYPPSISRR